jgi:isoleucyl-tRNA synthetase
MSDKQDTSKQDWRDTVFLPKTDFPMKAGLAQKEPAILKRWAEDGLYRSCGRHAPGGNASSSTTARPTPMATSTWAMR